MKTYRQLILFGLVFDVLNPTGTRVFLSNGLYERYSEIEKYVIYGDIAVIAARMMAMCVLSLLLLVVMLMFCPTSRGRRCSK